MKYKGFIIVESPAKARTLEKYAGKDYIIKASMGHIRDLPKNRIGIDVKNGFEPTYVIIANKNKVKNDLIECMEKAEKTYLATDPDREGEAIAWHLAEILGIPQDQQVRIELHEITPGAFKAALENPRAINMEKVNAQQARRMLDRLVGYNLSPVLWKKVAPGLSAGRVQSTAVRLISERQKEIDSFKSEEYWTISAICGHGSGKAETQFKAELVSFNDKKITIKNEEEAEEIKRFLESNEMFISGEPKKKINSKEAPLPYITSTLQQDASRRLGFKVIKTMKIAQQLFEGLDIGEEGPAGLITYMRTDSTRIADSAREDAVKYITEKYGSEYIGRKRSVKKKAGVQDAHEAIRPTDLFRDMSLLKKALTPDQFRLYSLIRDRFIASQMSPCKTEVTSADIRCGGDGLKYLMPCGGYNNECKIPYGVYRLHTQGSETIFDGFTKLYNISKEEIANSISNPSEDCSQEGTLPLFSDGDPISLKSTEGKQHFTQPSPQYTEASLVKALEKNGIGRPSTYAPIVETIQKRDYVKLDEKKFTPTKLGNVVTDLLVENFSEIVDISFTAHMESELDEIELGNAEYISVLKNFYDPFITNLKKVEKEINRVDSGSISEETGEICEKCGKPMIIKRGPYGKFLACSAYPECKSTKPYLEKIGLACPKCGTGQVIQKKSKKAVFYGCDRYPECDFTSWHRPIDKKCQFCGSPMVVKYTKSGKGYTQCMNACTKKKQEEEPESEK